MSLFRLNFSQHGDLSSSAANIVVGCCLTDIFPRDILVSTVLRAFAPALLLYLAITFCGTIAPDLLGCRTRTHAERRIQREVVAYKKIRARERIATVGLECAASSCDGGAASGRDRGVSPARPQGVIAVDSREADAAVASYTHSPMDYSCSPPPRQRYRSLGQTR